MIVWPQGIFMATWSRAVKQGSTTADDVVPPGLRDRLISRRLDMLALFRALDRLRLAQNRPPELHDLFELDADLAEALWVLDQPVSRFDLNAMTRDTWASLEMIPSAVVDFLRLLSDAEREQLAPCMKAVRDSLVLADAYLPPNPRSRSDSRLRRSWPTRRRVHL
jgi:hypothetical protein